MFKSGITHLLHPVSRVINEPIPTSEIDLEVDLQMEKVTVVAGV
jgi:hypothetical protein